MIRAARAALGLALLSLACVEVITAPDGIRFKAVAAGGAHTCALDQDGAAWCWGSNSDGQLGVSPRHRTEVSPVAVRGGRTFRALAAGERHTCALDLDDRAWCWGDNDGGQLGDGTYDDRDQPTPVLLDRSLSRIAPGGFHSCASDDQGAVWCWGRNEHGQIGPGPRVLSRPLRLEQAPAAGAVAAGGSHSCAIGPTGAFCWGANDRLQLGGATAADSPIPVRVASPTVLHVVAAGRSHSCAIVADATLACWGANDRGQLGRPGNPDAGTPLPVPGVGGGFALLATGPGGDLTCASGGASGRVWCWGMQEDPVLGPVVVRPFAAELPGGPVRALAVGNAHACALIGDRVRCWGAGGSGQLGDGRRESSSAPVGLARSAAG